MVANTFVTLIRNKRCWACTHEMHLYMADNVAQHAKTVSMPKSKAQDSGNTCCRRAQACSGSCRPEGGTDGGPRARRGAGPTEARSEDTGMHRNATSIIMTTMHAASLARFALLRCVSSLGTYLTRWGEEQDAMLFRMISYMYCTIGLPMAGFIGYDPDLLELSLFTDADVAGDRRDAKSTSGIFLARTGPHSFFPLEACRTKQTCCSSSTVEAEIVAAHEGTKSEGIPAMDLWATILGREPTLTAFEDSQATLRIVKSGKCPKLRHAQRVHDASITLLSDLRRKGPPFI